VQWSWWDLSLSKWPTAFRHCFDAVGWVIWPVKIVPKMTEKVSSGMLSLYILTCQKDGSQPHIISLQPYISHNSTWKHAQDCSKWHKLMETAIAHRHLNCITQDVLITFKQMGKIDTLDKLSKTNQRHSTHLLLFHNDEKPAGFNLPMSNNAASKDFETAGG